MHKLVVGIVILIASYAAQAQYAGYKIVADPSDFKTRFTAASQKINTIKSDFIQEKELSMLSEKIISRGKFFFKKENAVRMEYTQPFQYLMIINGSRIYVKDGQKENKISARSSKLFGEINKIMMDCVNGAAMSSADFTVKIFDGSDGFLAELSPVSKNLKTLFKNINLFVSRTDLAVTKIEMHEPSGDNTRISFVNRETNVTIPDALFVIN